MDRHHPAKPCPVDELRIAQLQPAIPDRDLAAQVKGLPGFDPGQERAGVPEHRDPDGVTVVVPHGKGAAGRRAGMGQCPPRSHAPQHGGLAGTEPREIGADGGGPEVQIVGGQAEDRLAGGMDAQDRQSAQREGGGVVFPGGGGVCDYGVLYLLNQ